MSQSPNIWRFLLIDPGIQDSIKAYKNGDIMVVPSLSWWLPKARFTVVVWGILLSL